MTGEQVVVLLDDDDGGRMLYVSGSTQSFRCQVRFGDDRCRANVFTVQADGTHRCNGRGALYEGSS